MEKYVFPDGGSAAYISSRQNGKVASAAKLSNKKYRDETETFLCEGVKLTLEAVRFGRITDAFILEEKAEELCWIAAAARSAGADVTVLSSSAFDKITTESSPQGIISVSRFPLSHKKWDGRLPDDFILMLDSIRDPGNLGSILRGACAFGRDTVILHRCADPYGPKAVRASMGALFKTRLIAADNGVDFISAVNLAGRRSIAAALDESSLTLGNFDIKKDDCVVIGNEGHGISEEIMSECSYRLRIPMTEKTESLNAAAAAAVILWEYRSKKI